MRLDLEIFPKDFLWGTATSAYQIEGAWNLGGKGISVWDTFSHTDGNIYNNQNGDNACDFYRFYKKDIDLMSELGYKALRLSISWTRIYPDKRGKINKKGIEYYRNVLRLLKERNIVTVVTLYHWDLPQFLENEGGWRNRATVDAFVKYAETCFIELDDFADYWITFNEPSVISYMGHFTGEMAPGLKDLEAAIGTIHNLNIAHGMAIKKLREIRPNSKIGMAIDRPIAEALDPEKISDLYAKRVADELYYYVFTDPSLLGDYPASFYEVIQRNKLDVVVSEKDLDLIYGKPDFLGLNYYTRIIVESDQDSPLHFSVVEGPLEKTEMGWELYPDGLFHAMNDIRKRYGDIPILITENGRSSKDILKDNQIDDSERISYLIDHIEICKKGIESGINLIGYLHWSFMDNFEWVYGYSRRFGLVYVDFKTGKRIPKRSAFIYSDIIRKYSICTTQKINMFSK